jgi:uncharacterized repeat protein (TIGR03803 family)
VKEVAMPSKKFLVVLVVALVVISGILSTTSPASAADREKILYAFKGGNGGVSPTAVIFDAKGNLYGATSQGGDFQCDRYFGCGTVFKLQPVTQGKWKKTILHTFRGAEGAYPGGGLILDAAGNLYGTTISGGAKGWGTVFKLGPGVDADWTETVLHNFNNKDGSLPTSSLIFDTTGNLYGTTQMGGAYNSGTVFKLVHGANGKWTETVLHSFNGRDGSLPTSALIFDSLGNLYGTTAGGLYGTVTHANWNCSGGACGNVFKLAPGADGKWTETVLHCFRGKDGVEPASGLVFDEAQRILYGTTVFGGDLTVSACGGYGCGTVFKVAPGTNGKWTETVLHKFNGWIDGSYPYAGLIFDAAGNLYGTTWYASGMVFKLAPLADGKWTETILHSFSGKDGLNPAAGLVFDGSGNLYGTTSLGGNFNHCGDDFGYGCGVVYEITP